MTRPNRGVSIPVNCTPIPQSLSRIVRPAKDIVHLLDAIEDIITRTGSEEGPEGLGCMKGQSSSCIRRLGDVRREWDIPMGVGNFLGRRDAIVAVCTASCDAVVKS
jgi:hypothetical protein